MARQDEAIKLMQRLAASPDLSTFRDKHHKVLEIMKQLSEGRQHKKFADVSQIAVTVAAALANGLKLLQPLLLLDLPKRALACLAGLMALLRHCNSDY